MLTILNYLLSFIYFQPNIKFQFECICCAFVVKSTAYLCIFHFICSFDDDDDDDDDDVDDDDDQGRRQGVTTENFSRGPQAKGGPGGPQEAAY